MEWARRNDELNAKEENVRRCVFSSKPTQAMATAVSLRLRQLRRWKEAQESALREQQQRFNEMEDQTRVQAVAIERRRLDLDSRSSFHTRCGAHARRVHRAESPASPPTESVHSLTFVGNGRVGREGGAGSSGRAVDHGARTEQVR